MESDRGSNPGLSDRWAQVTPLSQPAGNPSSSGQAGTVGAAVETETELEGARGLVKDAIDKTREKVTEYREQGMVDVTRKVTGYTRNQPVSALLVAFGVGMLVGILLPVSRR